MSAELPYRFETQGRTAVVSLLPGLDEVPWSDIEQIGSEIVEQLDAVKRPSLLVDLSALNYIGSAMVALLVRLWKSSNGRDGEMVVVNSDERVFEVLKISGLTSVWTIVDTRDAAEAELGWGARRGKSSGGAGGVLSSVLSLLLAIVGAAGLCLMFNPQESVPANASLSAACGGAVLALICGAVAAVRGTGLGRLLGLIAALSGLAIGVAVALKQTAML